MDRKPLIGAPTFSRRHIDQVAMDLFHKYLSIVGDQEVANRGLQFDGLYDQVIYPEYEIMIEMNCDLGKDREGRRVLGQFNVKENRAYIDRSLKDDPRLTFTMYHEVVGHGILQGEWLRHALNCSGTIQTSDVSLLPTTLDRLERQANRCAAMAAAPDGLLMYAIKYKFGREFGHTKHFIYKGPGTYHLDAAGHRESYEIGSKHALCRRIAEIIQPWFGGLSIESLAYRIEESPFLVDKSNDGLVLRRTELSCTSSNFSLRAKVRMHREPFH